ncbi:hypothetical protein O9K51_05541 [Purpureocillium lavendulum]|uniref:Uncharacterized protein n=1 Tax=Purpureocillium lavendulum TaxID=1247861 RepID=A0AB34FVA5_9HYPO|nr:hypothetical protein O9K51_05541 [Purpureocillium lavendulum]
MPPPLRFMDGQLLFVNQTPSSRAGSSERAAILSHVQSKRRRAEAGSRQPKPWSRFASTMSPPDVPPSSGESSRELADRASAEGRAVLQPSASRVTLSTMRPAFNATDPFHCTVAAADAGSHAALLHCTFSHAPRANFLAEAFAPASVLFAGLPPSWSPGEHRGPATTTMATTTRHDAVFRARLRACVDDQALMYATLAYGSSLLAWTTGRLFEHPPEYFLVKALRAVRERLREYDTPPWQQYLGGHHHRRRHRRPDLPVHDWLVLSVYALAMTEMWNALPAMWTAFPQRQAAAARLARHGVAASRTHLHALLHLVTRSGGWTCFDPYVLDSALLADKYLAISDMRPPVIPLTWDPGPRSAHGGDRCHDENVFPRLGTGFTAESLSQDLASVICDLVSYCRVAESIWSSKPVRVTNGDEAWLFRHLQAIKYRLLNHLHNASAGYTGRCVCLAAAIFSLACIPSRGPLVGAQYAATQLRALLLEADATNSALLNMSADMKLWCVCTGALLPETFDGREWFVHQVARQLDGDEMMQDLACRLEPYLFLPSRQGSYLSSLICTLADLHRKP